MSDDHLEIMRKSRALLNDKGEPMGVKFDTAVMRFPFCGDAVQGDMVVRCECGKYRGAQRPHGFKRGDE